MLQQPAIKQFELIHCRTEPLRRDEKKADDDPQEIPWISDVLRILKKNPKVKNVYFELGSTFNMLCWKSD